jgi:sulfur carrier protein
LPILVVNGSDVETTAMTLGELVAERGLAGTRVATARNGDFVPERARAATPLHPGDKIEIVSPRHGG